MKVLSLFDGMSCGRIALERAGIKVDTYYASEIDKHSIHISLKNYPDIIQLGDITKLTSEQLDSLGEIDLIIGGSPCQNLSISVIDNKDHNGGLEGQKSKLFYEYLRILRYLKPKYFLLENVQSMRDKDKNIITSEIGVEPVMIDSSLVSAQDRKRYYWTNIKDVGDLESKEVYIKNILEQNVDEKYYIEKPFVFHGNDKKIIGTLEIRGQEVLRRIYNPDFKCGTLTACRGGYKQKKVLLNGRVRKLTPVEYERLQTVPEGYTEGVADSHRYNMLGDGWTVDVISHIFKNIKYK